MSSWNPWHGCTKISPGCQNCYVYRGDERYGRTSHKVYKTATFDLPLRRNRQWQFDLTAEGGIVYTCFTSDFLLKEADVWREEAWRMMKTRSDLKFLFITKRILRLQECLPPDWGDGYENVIIGCTVENQEYADLRLPVFLAAPIKHRLIICSPLLQKMDLTSYLLPDKIEEVSVGGESGEAARPCDYAWVNALYEQTKRANIRFHFQQTGALFLKDGKTYHIKRRYQHEQARRADLEFIPE